MRQKKGHLPSSGRESAFSQCSTRPWHRHSCTSISPLRALRAPLPLGTGSLWGLAPARPTTGVLPEAAGAPCPVPHRVPGAADAAARLRGATSPLPAVPVPPSPTGTPRAWELLQGQGSLGRVPACPRCRGRPPRCPGHHGDGDLAGPHVPTGQRLPRARSRPLPPVISLPLDVPFFLPLPPKPAGKLEGQSAPLWLLG